jgi:N-ethylmaleimide reductase
MSKLKPNPFMNKLFNTHRLGNITLNNRIAMAPMTRSRAIKNIPNELIAEYYAQRVSAGLIVTEGTSPSPNGLGYARIPGIYSDEQVAGWKLVTDAVHAKGGKILLQLMHTGRVTHPLNLPEGGQVLAPSSVKLETTKMWVDDHGLLEIPVAKEMTKEDIRLTIDEHVQAAVNAIRAGFDGVEIHGANGYLIKQFINPHSNRRTDEYGGSIENRSRFLLNIAAGVANAIGKEKVGVRISPLGQFNETPAYAEAEATYLYIAQQLNELDIAYLHVNDQSVQGEANHLTREIRKEFRNTLILSGGYDAVKAETALNKNQADLIAFGRPFIANPDLVTRYKNKLPLNQLKFDLFYTPGAEGFVDYPVFEDVQIVG